MISEKYIAAKKRLIEQTEAQEISWRKSSGMDSYKYDFSKGAITIDNWSSDGHTPKIEFVIWSNIGDKIERIVCDSGDILHDPPRIFQRTMKNA